MQQDGASQAAQLQQDIRIHDQIAAPRCRQEVVDKARIIGRERCTAFCTMKLELRPTQFLWVKNFMYTVPAAHEIAVRPCRFYLRRWRRPWRWQCSTNTRNSELMSADVTDTFRSHQSREYKKACNKQHSH